MKNTYYILLTEIYLHIVFHTNIFYTTSILINILIERPDKQSEYIEIFWKIFSAYIVPETWVTYTMRHVLHYILVKLPRRNPKILPPTTTYIHIRDVQQKHFRNFPCLTHKQHVRWYNHFVSSTMQIPWNIHEVRTWNTNSILFLASREKLL